MVDSVASPLRLGDTAGGRDDISSSGTLGRVNDDTSSGVFEGGIWGGTADAGEYEDV